MWRELSRSSKIPGSSSSLLFFDGETWAHRLLPPFWWYLQTDKTVFDSWLILSRLTENSRFRLLHVGSKKSSVRLNSHGGLLPDRRFPYLSKDDGMTWWLPRYLPPPCHKCHGLARASKKACRGQRWFGHVCNSFTVSSRSAFSIYLRETNTVHFTSIEILGRPVCKGIVPLENFFCLNASYFRQ